MAQMEIEGRFSKRGLAPKTYLILMCACACLAVFGSLMNYEITTPTPPVPFTTELGNSYPGSFIYGVLLNITAVFGFVCVHILHGTLANSQLLKNCNDKINNVSLITGFAMFLGMIIFNAAPESSKRTPRFAGLVIFVGSFLLYGAMKCYLSYSTYRKVRKDLRRSIIIRFIVYVLALVSCVLLIVFYPPDSQDASNASTLLWSRPYHHGYRLVAVTAEWLLGACMVAFFGTFYGDMKYVTYGALQANLYELLKEEQLENVE